MNIRSRCCVRIPDPTDDEIRAFLAGNLCRCSDMKLTALRGIRSFLNSRKEEK